jgi:uncharacterized peroxidase-related enzyme
LLARLDAEGEAALPDERRKAMLRYVQKLTRTPARVTKGDVDALRGVGLADEDILAVAEVTAYYAYVNRIADGLGVAVEEWFDDDA